MSRPSLPPRLLPATPGEFFERLVLPSLLYLNHAFSPLDLWLWDPEPHVRLGDSIWFWLAAMLLFNLSATLCLRPKSSCSSGSATSRPSSPPSTSALPAALVAISLLTLGLAHTLHVFSILHPCWIFIICAITSGLTNALLLDGIAIPTATSRNTNNPAIPVTNLNSSSSSSSSHLDFSLLHYTLILTSKLLTLATAYRHGSIINPITLAAPSGLWHLFGMRALCAVSFNFFAPSFFPVICLRITIVTVSGLKLPASLGIVRSAEGLRIEPGAAAGARAGDGAGAGAGAANANANANEQPHANPGHPPRQQDNNSNAGGTPTPTPTPTPAGSTATRPAAPSPYIIHLNATYAEMLFFGFTNMGRRFLTDEDLKTQEARRLAPMVFAAGLKVIPP